MSIVFQRSSSADNSLVENLHILLTYIEDLYESGRFNGPEERFFSIVERCASKRPVRMTSKHSIWGHSRLLLLLLVWFISFCCPDLVLCLSCPFCCMINHNSFVNVIIVELTYQLRYVVVVVVVVVVMLPIAPLVETTVICSSCGRTFSLSLSNNIGRKESILNKLL